jgi:putative heme iron utilization protein
MTQPNPFTPDAVAAIVRHMNADHAEDTLAICRAFGGPAGATSARLADLGPDGLDLVAVVDGHDQPVHVEWLEPPTDRPGVRHQIVRLFEAAVR